MEVKIVGFKYFQSSSLPDFQTCTSVHGVVINVHIHLSDFMGNHFYRRNMIVRIEIIRIEQSILFGKKRVFSWRKGQEEITIIVRSYCLDQPGANSAVKGRFTLFGYLTETGELIYI